MCSCVPPRRFRRVDCRLSCPKVTRFRSPRIAAGKFEEEQQFSLVGSNSASFFIMRSLFVSTRGFLFAAYQHGTSATSIGIFLLEMRASISAVNVIRCQLFCPLDWRADLKGAMFVACLMPWSVDAASNAGDSISVCHR
jgi:hypothetical protein